MRAMSHEESELCMRNKVKILAIPRLGKSNKKCDECH